MAWVPTRTWSRSATSWWTARVRRRDSRIRTRGGTEHFALCLVRGALVDRSRCREHGRLLDGRDLWMLHAWVVPEWSNPWGTFAPLNPRRVDAGVAGEAHAHPGA